MLYGNTGLRSDNLDSMAVGEVEPVAEVSSSSNDQSCDRNVKRRCTRAQGSDGEPGREVQASCHPGGPAVEEILLAQAANAEQHDDPFGFNQLGFDEGQALGLPAEPALTQLQGDERETLDIAAPQSSSGSTQNANAGDAGNQASEYLVTARERRKLILSQAAERNKRRRMETDALARAWDGGEAAVSLGNYMELLPAPAAPPFPVHPTHSLVVCGGFTGCVRCGRVVAYQGHDRFKDACRGYCPSGSQRPIRRLVRGDYPHDLRQSHVTPPWPDGGHTPTPRRWHPS